MTLLQPYNRLFYSLLYLLFSCSLTAQSATATAAKKLDLTNLAAFVNPGPNWKIAGAVKVAPTKKDAFKTAKGSGILVNLPDDKNRSNLQTRMEHGDLDLDLEFMMAPGSNSGIYLQGRYEIQLRDSWGKQRAGFGDCGGVYERWDDQRPDGRQGFQGVAPRMNVCRAPGLWQKLFIAYRAPRFNSAGQKTEHARILEIRLNDIIIHENIELTGPTRGAALPGEATSGPILIQGDHGAVAFRNIHYRSYQQIDMKWSKLDYQLYRGEYDYVPDFSKEGAPEDKGSADALSWEVANTPNEFALRFDGSIRIPETGDYQLHFHTNGNGWLKIRDSLVFDQRWGGRDQTIRLEAGELPITIAYAKREGWLQPRLGLFIAGPGFRQTALHLPSSYLLSQPVDPIYLEPQAEARVLRSFVDYQQNDSTRRRIVHAISVGSPQRLHYTYDLDRAALAQTWRGDYLDVTPMWNNRGDGSARPAGSVLRLSDATPYFSGMTSTDTFPSPSDYDYRGYRVNDKGYPTYRYTVFGNEMEDEILPDETGKKFSRKITMTKGNGAPLSFVIARGSQIEEQSDGLFAVDDQRYFIRLNDSAKAQIQSSPTGSKLIFEWNKKNVQTLHYDIIF